MKKILITIIIFMFTSTVTGYAQFFKDNDRRETTTNSSDESGYSSGNSEGGAGFFKTPPARKPGGRPETGDGIGQQAPLEDGLSVLIVCGVILVIVKVSKNRWNSRRKSAISNLNPDSD